MQTSPASIVVLPSFTEMGVVSKDERGIVAENNGVPEALRPLENAVGRIAAKLGVNLATPGDQLAAAFEAALSKRAAQPVQSSPDLPAPTP